MRLTIPAEAVSVEVLPCPAVRFAGSDARNGRRLIDLLRHPIKKRKALSEREFAAGFRLYLGHVGRVARIKPLSIRVPLS